MHRSLRKAIEKAQIKTKTITLTELDASKVRACIKYQINQFKQERLKLESEDLDTHLKVAKMNTLTSLIEYYECLSEKF